MMKETTREQFWSWQHQRMETGYPIYNDDNEVVAYGVTMIAARRIVAGMNQVKNFTTPELENTPVISNLLGRITKLQRLLVKHLYFQTRFYDKRLCGECKVQEGGRHGQGYSCSVLNSA